MLEFILLKLKRTIRFNQYEAIAHKMALVYHQVFLEQIKNYCTKIAI